jgi:thymidylate synthase (FAD)
MLKVKLLQHTQKPEQTVALAARLCYSAMEISKLRDKLTEEEVRALLAKLLDSGHVTPFEHASFTFGVEGVSRAMTHQLVRHRLASFSQQSQRYATFKQNSFILPPSVQEDEKARELMLAHYEAAQRTYQQLLDLGFNKEDARYVLPEASATKIIITMNSRELFHFFNLRCCERAQWEIRAMATEMLRLAKGAAPIIFENAGPQCVKGPCPEGKFSCGNSKKVRARFKSLASDA